MHISGIGGVAQPTSLGVTHFDVSHLKHEDQTLPVDAVILHKVTTDLPSHPTCFDQSWKHLLNIQLADPEFGTPSNIDILLGADVFSRAMCHGGRFGPPGSPSACRTCFGWVLSSSVHSV